MDFFKLNQGVLIYNDEIHSYMFKGKRILSITEAIKIVNDKYKFVPKSVLEPAQIRGNKIHFDIQMYEDYNVKPEPMTKELTNYILLKKHFGFEFLESETPVLLEYKGYYLAGRFDLKVKDRNGVIRVIDIKSTSTFDKQYVALQTELYKLGHNQSYPEKAPVTECGGIHLNGDKRKYDRYLPKVDLDVFFAQLDEAIKEMEDKKEGDK